MSGPSYMTAAEFARAQEALGWSAAKMADQLGIHKRTVLKYKSGRQRVPLPVSKLLWFHVTAHAVLHG